MIPLRQRQGGTYQIATRCLLPLLHESVGFNLFVEVDQVSRVAPGLDALLLADSVGEESRPLYARVGLVDLSAGGVVNQLAEVANMRVEASVVVGSGQLNELSDVGDSSVDAHVLVADDGFGSGLSLIGGSTEVLEYMHGLNAAVDVKGHTGGGQVLLSSAEIME